MPDRLVDLYAQLAQKVEDLDRSLRAVVSSGKRRLAVAGAAGVPVDEAPGDLARANEDLNEVARLVAKQKEILGEIARHMQEVSALSAFLQTHYEREKARLARELHDELGGILTPAKMDLAWLQAKLGEDPVYAKRMSRLAALIDQGIDLKRRIIEDLHPSLLDHLGLATAVQWYVEEACKSAQMECHVDGSRASGRLDPDLEIAMYRIVQESVTNAVRHSQAKHVEVTLERTATGLRITVRDDGVGMEDVEKARKHGLAGMSQRMRALNGTLQVTSRRGGGTRIEAFLPLEERAAIP
jgi:signal transduction histidine kinase